LDSTVSNKFGHIEFKSDKFKNQLLDQQQKMFPNVGEDTILFAGVAWIHVSYPRNDFSLMKESRMMVEKQQQLML
jgi:hypothetical protein